MRNKILSLLEQNAGLKHDQIAVMLDMSVEQVDKEIEEMTKEGILLRSKALINWEKTDREFVAAQIELKVTPQRGEGFDKIAERIYQYPEVKSVYLISGGFDIAVTIEGRTMKEVALFVAEKLSTMEHVTSTKTNFILKKYKQDGVLFAKEGKDERAVIS